MATKELAQTGKRVSTVGLGTAFVGRRPEDAGAIAGGFTVDHDLAVETIRAGLDAGISLVDTAPYYGTEDVVGLALRETAVERDDFAVMTKVGRPGLEDFDYTRDGALRSIDRSLSALGVDYLDVVSVHDAVDVPFDDVMSGAWQALSELREQGIVRAIGTACWDHRINAEYVRTGGFQAVICSSAFSLLNHAYREHILPAATQVGATLIAAEPLERGLLALGVQPGREYAQRRFTPEVLAKVNDIEEIARAHGHTLLEVSLQWLSREPLAIGGIPGPANAAEAVSNARAVQNVISETVWAELDKHIVDWPLESLGIHLP